MEGKGPSVGRTYMGLLKELRESNLYNISTSIHRKWPCIRPGRTDLTRAISQKENLGEKEAKAEARRAVTLLWGKKRGGGERKRGVPRANCFTPILRGPLSLNGWTDLSPLPPLFQSFPPLAVFAFSLPTTNERPRAGGVLFPGFFPVKRRRRIVGVDIFSDAKKGSIGLSLSFSFVHFGTHLRRSRGGVFSWREKPKLAWTELRSSPPLFPRNRNNLLAETERAR